MQAVSGSGHRVSRQGSHPPLREQHVVSDNQESSGPMEVDPGSGEPLHETRRPHEKRGDAIGAHTGGRISNRTTARTRAAATTSERARDNRQPSDASPPQHMVNWVAPPAPQLRSVPSQRAPDLPQRRLFHPNRGMAMTLRSPVVMSLGPPPTPTPPLRRSRVPVGEPLLSPAETAARTSVADIACPAKDIV